MKLKILRETNSPPHDSSSTHVTGQSVFVDDRPMLTGELFVVPVYSPYARAKLVSWNQKAALAVPGVVEIVTADDVIHNKWGPIFHDQPVIAKDIAEYAGEPFLLVAGESVESVRRGIRALEPKWTKLPAIRSIREAIKAQTFFGPARSIERGDVEGALKKSARTKSGTLVIEGADHFYLESQAAVALPGERGAMEVHASTQHPTETQHVVAESCGLAFSQVTVVVKRLGGGFGGKESQASPVAAWAALVAKKTGRPARVILTKDDDMIMTGKRNPFEIDWTVGFSDEGDILALDAELWSDGGAYADLSTAIMERAMLHSDNAYFIPAMQVRGRVCRTNHHPHTAFRGFGGPKGMAMIESVIEEIARDLKKDAFEIRRRNVYRPGFDETHYGQKVENNLLPDLFDDLAEKCEYHKRRRQLEGAAASPGMLRGISMTAVKFGISFTTRHLNQGNALVCLHRDGSIQVSTGAVEMGQGVNTRIAMLVAEQFGVKLSRVAVLATSTDKNANTSPTAASSGTDLNGGAALVACRSLKIRLAALTRHLLDSPRERWPSQTAGPGTAPEFVLGQDDGLLESVIFRDGRVWFNNRPDRFIEFSTLLTEAWLSRVSLSEYGFWKIPGLGFNKVSGQGRAFLYYTQGVCCSEVAVDPVTGTVKVLRVDLLMDLGRTIAHGLDMGQVTGAFVQGLGWVTTEKLHYSDDGLLLSHSPSTYKIPSVQDMPRIFNCDLVENNANSANIRGTKAAGEPPLMLALSVWTAIRDALRNAGADPSQLPIPATAERIVRCWRPDFFKWWDET
jgi:xanthine dehydrogenase large subunit